MQIIRFTPASDPLALIGIDVGDAVVAFPEQTTLADLLTLRLDDLRERCEQPGGRTWAPGDLRLLPPVDGRTEVWAAGVTYESSRLARMKESEHDADIYARVYNAERPELFFKAASWKVRGHREPIGIRADSPINVPEPEAALVANAHGEIVGLTVCNDVSSRSLEAQNPLYLPQAKIYAGACALGPGIRPAWEIPDPLSLALTLTIRRDGTPIWSGDASTAQLRRDPNELVAALFSADFFPEGLVLSTGTCLVPELPFTLEPGDEVSITVGDVGTLTNPVTRGLTEHLRDLSTCLPSETRPATRAR